MSDLTTALERRGAVRADVDGTPTVASFGDPAAEYTALRERAGVVDWAWWGLLRVTGSDRVPFLQGMLSNDVKALAAGDGCTALLLSEQGRAVADLVVLATDDAILLAGHAASLAGARAALERFIVADDVEIVDESGTTRALAVLGPQASEVLGRTGLATPTTPYGHVQTEIDDVPVDVVRVPTPGAGGFACFAPAPAASRLWARVVDAGGATPVGYAAYDVLRIESGVPWHGRDVTAETLALEAPYDVAISFRKGCYLGQEVMERVTARGHVNRKLVGLVLAGDALPPAQAHVFAGDRDVGWVTSAAWSWRLGHPVALAYVRREHLEPGTTLAVGDDPKIVATVRAWPL
jgi:folate-binding protein YgfZ